MDKTKKTFHKKGYLNWILANFNFVKKDGQYEYVKNGNSISINPNSNSWFFEQVRTEYGRTWDLSIEENIIKLILCLKLLERGYNKRNIILEKSFHLGHNNTGYVDIAIEKDGQIYWMIEAKVPHEISKYLNPNQKYIKQLFSYLWQEKSTKIASYYTFELISEKFGKDCFYNINLGKDELDNSLNVDNLIDRWNKQFDETNLLLSQPFDIKISGKKFRDLKDISERDSKILFSQFLTILRTNAISDKSNAFDKIINLFIAKVFDELGKDKRFEIRTKDENVISFEGLKFQFLEGVDTYESFMKRLHDLYKEGMKEYLQKEIIDYSDPEILNLLNSKKSQKILEMIDDLRLKKDNTFAFIEVFDNKTFKDNCLIVKEVVGLLANFKFRYADKSKSLGEFFEDLLNTSLKQEAGQFFTPSPLIEFMINSLPIKDIVKQNIQQNKNEILPFFYWLCLWLWSFFSKLYKSGSAGSWQLRDKWFLY